MVRGKPNGYITAVHKYGAIYEGNYSGDRLTDFGRLIAVGGAIQIGWWKDSIYLHYMYIC